MLQNIENALEIVEYENNQSTPVKKHFSSIGSIDYQSSPSPRLRDKIHSVLSNSPKTHSLSSLNYNQRHQSSPLSPATEKSHITFDILNELETFKESPRRVHFAADAEGDKEMSVASREYLKKYGLLN